MTKGVLNNLIPPSGGRRFLALDGLRGLAVLAVMLCHLHNVIFSNPASPSVYRVPLNEAAGVGVGVFFVLSAFLLYYPWAKPAAKIGVWSYYRRRLWRIYPAYCAGILLGVLVLAVTGVKVTGSGVLLHVSFLHSWFTPDNSQLLDPAWSLPAEMQFYLLLPLLALAFRAWWLALGLVFGAVLAQCLTPWMWPWKAFPWGNWPTLALPFLVGMLAAQVAANRGDKRGAGYLSTIGLVGLLAFVFFAPKPAEHAAGFSVALFAMQGILASLATGLILVGLTSGANGWLQILFSSRPLRAVGICGYSLFLFHDPIFHLLNNLGGRWVCFVGGIPVTLLLGAVSYLYIEAPAMRLAHRLRARQPILPAAPSPADNASPSLPLVQQPTEAE